MSSEIVLITGAGGMLGRIMTRHFLAARKTVIAASHRSETLSELSAFVSNLPGRIEGVIVDLEREGGDILAQRLAERDLLPQAIVNNAVDLDNQRISDTGRPTREQWRAEFELAVTAPAELTMAVAELPKSPLAAVVNIASMYGVVARNPNLYDDPLHQSPIHYGVAKAAMIHLTKELAVRLAPRSIRVNSVSFGGVEGRVDQPFVDRYSRMCPSGRMLRTDEVPQVVDFLLSDGASAITGHNLVADGGWTVW